MLSSNAGASLTAVPEYFCDALASIAAFFAGLWCLNKQDTADLNKIFLIHKTPLEGELTLKAYIFSENLIVRWARETEWTKNCSYCWH
jgi:hypothetical protein